MEYIAESKNIKISPRKVRLVADSIRDMALARAIVNLGGLNKRAADPIRKTLESAIANAVNNFNASKDALTIKEIMINEGIMYKRYHYAARGRVRPYKKRTSHIRVVLMDNIIRDVSTNKPAVIAPQEVKEEKQEKKSVLAKSLRLPGRKKGEKSS